MSGTLKFDDPPLFNQAGGCTHARELGDITQDSTSPKIPLDNVVDQALLNHGRSAAHNPTVAEAAAILHSYIAQPHPSLPRLLLQPRSRTLARVVALVEVPSTPPLISRSGSIGITSSVHEVAYSLRGSMPGSSSTDDDSKSSGSSDHDPVSEGAQPGQDGTQCHSAPINESVPSTQSHSSQVINHDITRGGDLSVSDISKGHSPPDLHKLKATSQPQEAGTTQEKSILHVSDLESGSANDDALHSIKLKYATKLNNPKGSHTNLVARIRPPTSRVGQSTPVISSATHQKEKFFNILKFKSAPNVKQSPFKNMPSIVTTPDTLHRKKLATQISHPPSSTSVGECKGQEQGCTSQSQIDLFENESTTCHDRFYDPDDEDNDKCELPAAYPAIRIEYIPLKDAHKEVVTSSSSLRPGSSRKMVRPVPSSEIAAYLDPLASARNLLMGMEEGSLRVNFGGVSSSGDDSGAGADYLQYLLTRKFSSTNFITRYESHDIISSGQSKATAKFIGPFILGMVIGKGSFGKVKDAMCSETLQSVAIKILSHQRLRKVQFGIESVTHEIHTLRKLRGHPNVVRLLEVYSKVEDSDGDVDIVPWTPDLESVMRCKTLKRFMVFEFCHGNLQSLLDSAPLNILPLHQTQDYMIQLTEGLIYLHARHVVHRDIKPANLLLTLDGVLKISDFGVAEVLSPYDGNDFCQNFAGTQQFMSPEVASGESQPSGEKVDVWAAGVTLYNMVFGTFPFYFPGNADTGDQNQPEPMTLELPKDIHNDLCELLRGVLDNSPATRLSLSQVRTHPFLGIESSELAPGPYVPLPTLTADAAIAHATATLGRGKGTLARPVSPRTLSRRPQAPEIHADVTSDQNSKLPYSLFPILEPLFPELATLSPLPESARRKLTVEGKDVRRSGALLLRRHSNAGSSHSKKGFKFRLRKKR